MLSMSIAASWHQQMSLPREGILNCFTMLACTRQPSRMEALADNGLVGDRNADVARGVRAKFSNDFDTGVQVFRAFVAVANETVGRDSRRVY